MTRVGALFPFRWRRLELSHTSGEVPGRAVCRLVAARLDPAQEGMEHSEGVPTCQAHNSERACCLCSPDRGLVLAG